MEIMFYIIIFVLGLCFGSFVNMLIYRTAVRYKLISNFKFPISKLNPSVLKNKTSPFDKGDLNKKRSFCDYCGKQLSWYENVPVLSWLIQMGKTRCCQKKLPVSYLIVEMMMGILFCFYYFIEMGRHIGLPLQLQDIIGFIVIVLLVFSAVFDWKYMILPDFSTVILVGCAVVFLFVETPYMASLQVKILSALIASGFLLILNLITKGKGMGMGDVKLAVFMGLFLGYPNIILAFYVAFIVGAIYGVILMIFKKAKKKSQVPFGPFLILGTLVGWMWGNSIINLVFSILY